MSNKDIKTKGSAKPTKIISHTKVAGRNHQKEQVHQVSADFLKDGHEIVSKARTLADAIMGLDPSVRALILSISPSMASTIAEVSGTGEAWTDHVEGMLFDEGRVESEQGAATSMDDRMMGLIARANERDETGSDKEGSENAGKVIRFPGR